MRAAPLAIAGLLGAFLACESFEGSDETPAPDRDAGADPDASGGPCAANVLYVSGSGDDANDGCTPDRPIKTIRGALALASAKKLELPEIRVCGGTYSEPGIRISRRVVLRGKFNCNTWTRNNDNLVLIENAAYPNETATVVVTGADLDRAVVIDGFTIRAPASGDVGSAALVVNSARPKLEDLVIEGGGTKGITQDEASSIGLDVRDNGSPEVAACNVRGGSGTGASEIGSVGILVRPGSSIDLHDSTVESGTGAGPYGGIGVRLIKPAAGARIARTQISYKGTSNGFPQSAYGVVVNGGALEISESFFRGVLGACNGSPSCTTAAVFADGGTVLNATRNRVYAGDVQTGTSVDRHTIGFHFGADVEAVATNNIVHAGGTASDGNTQTLGFDIAKSKSTKIFGNTIISPATNSKANGGVSVGAPGGAGTGGNSVIGNLFVGRGKASDIALGLATCGAARYDDVRSNAFVNYPFVLIDVQGPCVGGQADAFATTATAQSYLGGLGTTADGNVMLRPGCDAPDCIGGGVTCATLEECAKKVFETWHDPSGGLNDIEGGTGLRFSPAGPCAFFHASPPWGQVVTNDFFGAMRTPPAAIGHHEQELCE